MVPDGHTRRAIVRLLLESGSITAGEIGDQLGLSAAGVRRHLDALIEAGDAESVAAAAWQQVGRGRPAKRYRLTPAGRAKLGCIGIALIAAGASAGHPEAVMIAIHGPNAGASRSGTLRSDGTDDTNASRTVRR